MILWCYNDDDNIVRIREKKKKTGDFVKCGGSQLVHSTYWCDGWPECTDNHADELFCNYFKLCCDIRFPNRSNRSCLGNVTCSQHDRFQCPNGRCINTSNVCDGICDCLKSADGLCADETNCTRFYKEIDGMNFLFFVFFQTIRKRLPYVYSQTHTERT